MAADASRRRPSEAERWFAEWIAAREAAPAGESGDGFETLCAQHAEHATELRKLRSDWEHLAGVLEQLELSRTAGPGAPASPSLAERIRARYGSGVDPGITLEPEAAGPAPSDFSSEILRRLAARPDASGRYRLRGEVAHGGMGAILRVWDEDLRRHLAMKVILGKVAPRDAPPRATPAPAQERKPGEEFDLDAPTPPVDPRSVGRFLEEAQVTGQLDHPGIVPVHELGLDSQGRVFFTMKLVKGEDLKAVFARVFRGEEGWSSTRALGLLLKVCEAMAYAHAKHVIHRDLKPANVMVGKYGEVFVMDWGLAKVLGRKDNKDVRIRPEAPTTSEVRSERRQHAAEHPDSPLITMDGDIVGTPAYMSPEQAKGQVEQMGPPSDVYALGALLYHLLTARMPYVVPDALVNNHAILSRVQEGPPKPVHELSPQVPAELVAICEKAMAREPAKRYADMSALAEDLRAYLEHRVVSAYETGALAELRKWVVRNKPLAAALAAGVLLLLGGLTSSLILKKQSDRNAAQASANATQAKAAADLAEERRKEADANAQLAEERRLLAERNEQLASEQRERAERGEDLAKASAVEAQRQETIARREKANVLRLSAFQELEDLRSEAAALWPATPGLLPRYDAWLARAAVLVAGLDPRPDGEDLGHRRQLELLRERALPQTDEERSAERQTHPAFAELESLHAKVAWMKSTADVRAGRAELPSFELDLAALPIDASALNGLAWDLVDPERTVFGREAEGLALARLAFERASPEDVSTIGDTLAWALFANGLDAEAMAASEAALAAAAEDRRKEFEGYLAEVRRAIEEASDPGALARGEAALAALEAAASARRTWRFASEEDTWWHNQLQRLLAEIDAFRHPQTGLVDGISEEHGWGVRRRRDFAATVEERTIGGEEARRRWSEALASIADPQQCPAYGGLTLPPQLGLLPIGRDAASGLWEFWHVQSGDEPLRGADGKLVLTEGMGLVLVLLPGGTFWMGAKKEDPEGQNYDPAARSDEEPVHAVTLSPYFLSKYEMTQGQWERFTGRNPSGYGPGTTFGGHATTRVHPVEQMDWNQCMEVCRQLGLVLPTEAQWEYGARGGTTTSWWTGQERESLIGAANLADQAAAQAGAMWTDIQDWPELDDDWAVHAAVGSYRANPFGLHDVHGNLWEWCRDGYDSGFYGRSPEQDPFREPAGTSARGNRGGSFYDPAASARSANRDGGTPEDRANDLGLRPAQGITTF